MSASQIPNLNTLLGSRGMVRDRVRSRPGQSTDDGEGNASHDRIVQQTDQDASISRLSAAELGYLDDPFTEYFVPKEKKQRRMPIINRGTYVRTKAIDNLVQKFIDNEPSKKKQIISLGAGTDTRVFRLMNRRSGNYESSDFIYHELDFSENMSRKLKPIYGNSEVSRHCQPECVFSSSTSRLDPKSDPQGDTCSSQTYCAHPIDLRTLDPAVSPPSSFRHIDQNLPTILISECCLCYLSPTAADRVALYFSKHFFPQTTPLGFILYEPINPEDAFGKVMVSNLASRGIVLQTLKKYASLEAQAARMKFYGFEKSGGADVNQLWKENVSEKEKERIANLEMMDEMEEWELLAAHYAIVWGWRGEGYVWRDPIEVVEDFRGCNL